MVTTYDVSDWPSIVDLRREERAGNVTGRPHPRLPLIVWNYTPQVQFSYEWNEVTSKARGLVTDKAGSVIAPCIPKFYNYIDHDEEWFKNKTIQSITEKIDGSMINIFYYGDEWIACSRGSFESDQALMATEMINRTGVTDVMLDRRRSYIAELVHPENRIVVDYGSEESLYLLTMFQKGKQGNEWIEYPWNYTAQFTFSSWIGRMPNTYDRDTFDRVLDQGKSNFEGFVVRYTDNSRVKFKLEEYVKLHRVATGVTSKRLAKMWIRDELGDYLSLLPDELYQKVEEVLDTCRRVLDEKKAALEAEFNELPIGEDRKEFAMVAKETSDPAFMFLFYDNKTDEIVRRLEKWLLEEFESLDIPSLNEDSIFRKAENRNEISQNYSTA